jgi:nucleotide-binding universal stress UspA family protein
MQPTDTRARGAAAQSGRPAIAPAPSLLVEIVDDEPYSALRNKVGSFGADLLAMGTHASSRLSTAIVGSLARSSWPPAHAIS